MQSIWLKILSLGWQKLVLVGAVIALLGGLTNFYVVKNYRQGRQDPKNNLQATTKKPAKKLPTTQEQSESAAQDSSSASETPSQYVSVLKPSATKPSTESSDQPTSQSEPEQSSSSSNDQPASSGPSSSTSSSNQTPAQTTTPSPSSSQPAPTSSPAPTTPAESTDTCGNDVGNGNDIIAGPAGPSGGDADRPFRSLSVHPSDPNTLTVGTERNGALKTTDGGQSWSRLRKGLRHIDTIGYPEFWDIAISKTNPSTVFAATLDSPGPVTGNSYPSAMAGIYKSTDSGSTWSRMNCGLTNSRITSIIIDSTNASRVVAGIEGGAPSFSDPPAQYYDGGIYYTTDGGTNWSPATVPGKANKNGYWYMLARGTSAMTYSTFAMNYDDLTENVGFIRSTDGGKTWTAFASELKNLRITNFDISADGQTIYASPRDWQQIKKSTDGGATWTTIDTNATGLVAVSPNDANLVMAANCCSVFRSTDGFATDPPKVLTLNKVSDIVFAPSDPSVVWLIAEGYLLYKSTDSGASFTLTKNLRSGVLNTGG